MLKKISFWVRSQNIWFGIFISSGILSLGLLYLGFVTLREFGIGLLTNIIAAALIVAVIEKFIENQEKERAKELRKLLTSQLDTLRILVGLFTEIYFKNYDEKNEKLSSEEINLLQNNFKQFLLTVRSFKSSLLLYTTKTHNFELITSIQRLENSLDKVVFYLTLFDLAKENIPKTHIDELLKALEEIRKISKV